MSASAKILIIDDNASDAQSLKQLLESEGYQVQTACNAVDGLRCAQDGCDVVVSDLHLSGSNALHLEDGLEVIRSLHTSHPQLPVILMTGHHTTKTAIEAMKLGAYDYITKPIDEKQFIAVIEKAAALSEFLTQTPEPPKTIVAEERIIGNSPAMHHVYKQIGRIAATPVTVLIRGETGTGKELVARAVHAHSDRAEQPFIVVNCPAIPANLLASELFGHEVGAFTDAKSQRIGRFEQARHGTIFLDEIGDMPEETQKQLLRVLQNKTIQRLGGKETISVDARVIAATHRDLELAIVEKEFRQDLYYRLNVATVELPPLRERREDIPLLVEHFLARHGNDLGWPNATIAPDAVEFLQQQSWTGNVRELENVTRKSLLLARGYTIRLENVREAITTKPFPIPGSNQTLSEYAAELLNKAKRGELENVAGLLTAEMERELYSQALRLANGDQSKAASWLGVSRPTVREKLTRYEIKFLRE